uniref:Uncharacterized protein n=1 Tax=Myoviridae sp. ctn8H20 TaxID=2825169 RepID=A0A8S5QG57_9CAUD|nr:MAG TPA: hypothetical protein [Myoviridae sp. ctn8H20]
MQGCIYLNRFPINILNFMVSFNLLEVDEQYVRQIFKCIRDLLFVGS